MANQKRANLKKQDEVESKHHSKQQEPESSFDQFHAWDMGYFSLSEKPFEPRMDEHAELLAQAAAHSDVAAHNLVMQLHQTYGNRYVQRLLKSNVVQAKLTVNAPGDIYEQEADRVAEAVTKAVTSLKQRQVEEEEGEEEEVQAKLVQRQVEEEEEEVQAKLVRRQGEEEEEIQAQSTENQPATVSENLETRINDARGSGHPLSDNVREPMEQAFGADFNGVRVHTDSQADLLSQELSARAFTTARDIFFRQGEYSLGTDSGKKLIAHELTHVMQQSGRNKPQRQSVKDEETQMKLDTRRVEQDGSQVDSEVESALQGVRDGGQPIYSTVQRMVVAATDDMAKVKDPLVWNNLEFAKSEVGGHVGDMTDWDKFKSGEPVRIVGHGDPDSGELSAESDDPAHGVNATFYDADMITNHIKAVKGLDRSKLNWWQKLRYGKKLKKLEFQSCYASKKIPPPGPAPAPGPALIDRMRTELQAIGQKGVEVAGRPGIAFGFRGMGAATAELTEAEYDRTMTAMQARNPQTKNGRDIFKAPNEYNDPWIIAGVATEAAWNLLSIEEKMDNVADQMEDYWKDFKTEMGPAGFLDTAAEIRKITS